MRVLGNGYRTIITHAPWIWRFLYRCADRIPLGGDTIDGLPFVTRGAAKFLNELHPAALVSTYPLYGHIIERLFGAGPLPFGLLTVVTDSTSINHSWINGADGHYAVADTESADYFVGQGVASQQVHVTGFPVHPAFGAERPAAAPEPRLPDPFRILYTPSTKTPVVTHTFAALSEFARDAPVDVELTVVLGRHETRLREIAESAAPEGTEILGWTDRIPELLGASHLLIGKAGGASVQEALCSACPMLVNYVVPGQEEGNAERLCAAGAGAMMPTPDKLVAYLDDLVADGGARWLAMRSNAFRAGRPDAAATVAGIAIELATKAGAI